MYTICILNDTAQQIRLFYKYIIDKHVCTWYNHFNTEGRLYPQNKEKELNRK